MEINIEENMGLVFSTIIRTFGSIESAMSIARNNSIDYEDLVQIGRIALWKASTKFDESKGYTFSTYASRCINGYLLNEMNKSIINISTTKYTLKERQEIVSSILSIHKQFGETKEDTLENILEDEFYFEDKLITNIDMENLLSILSDKNKAIVIERMNGLTFKQIAAKVNSTEHSCRNCYGVSMKKLKANYASLKISDVI